MTNELNLLNEFNVMECTKVGTPYLDLLDYGFVLDFVPTPEQINVLKSQSRKIDVKTLFSREERNNSDPFVLITKQVFHYIETYGLNMPGLFGLEVDNGSVVSLRFVKGVSKDEIQNLVNTLIYQNAPIKDVNAVASILKEYSDFELNKVANNDLRIELFDVTRDKFESGDDAVRWLTKNYGKSSLLIKSQEVINAIVSNNANIPNSFLKNHELVLSQVFNRHKRLIVAAKHKGNRTIINKIARLSKKTHQPLHQSIAKTFLSLALNNPSMDYSCLDKISVRDKFKYLNLLAWKRAGFDVDAFVIRNGKIHVEPDRKTYDQNTLDTVENAVLNSLKADLHGLYGKTILLDKNVDFGLPISRKQTLGNLPFGTTIKVDSDEISAGMHWRNEWGARDLDLSAINEYGERTGWGHYSGYDKNNPITFSGDITDAYNGAMEFMTSHNANYGLFVNIFSGNDSCDLDIVVGRTTTNDWITDSIIKERVTLNSKGSIIGFVKGKTFVVYSGRLNNSRVSRKNPIVARGLSEFWTVEKLLVALGVNYDLDKKDVDYDIDLTYSNFSFDKLEKLINISTKVVP